MAMPPITKPWWESVIDGYVQVETPLPNADADGVVLVTRCGVFGDTVYHREIHFEPVRYSSADLDTIAVRAARGEPGQ